MRTPVVYICRNFNCCTPFEKKWHSVCPLCGFPVPPTAAQRLRLESIKRGDVFVTSSAEHLGFHGGVGAAGANTLTWRKLLRAGWIEYARGPKGFEIRLTFAGECAL